jgi:hypothetical protein
MKISSSLSLDLSPLSAEEKSLKKESREEIQDPIFSA